MTTKHKNAIRRGLKKARLHQRRSKAMKASWERRRFDKEAGSPNACVNAATESLVYREALTDLNSDTLPVDFSRIEAMAKLWRGLRDQASWFMDDAAVLSIISGAIDRVRLEIMLECQKGL